MIIKMIFITMNKNVILNFLSLFDISKKKDCKAKAIFFYHHQSLRIHNIFLSFLKFCISSPEDAWHGTAAGGVEQETSMMMTTTENVCGLSGSISRNSCHRRTWETRTFFFFFLTINVLKKT